MIVGKLKGKLVQIVRVTDRVQFSADRGWICICTDFQNPRQQQAGVKWVPASTQFDWVRNFKWDPTW